MSLKTIHPLIRVMQMRCFLGVVGSELLNTIYIHVILLVQFNHFHLKSYS
jgi:hypothetical protein